MWDTVGVLCRVSSSDVKALGEAEVRASGTSGVSSTRRVFREVVDAREETAVASVVLRWVRSRDVRV